MPNEKLGTLGSLIYPPNAGIFGSKSVASWVCTYDARVIRANVFGLLSSIRWHLWQLRLECHDFGKGSCGKMGSKKFHYEVFTAQRVKVQLLLLELCLPESREGEQMISACTDNDSMVLEELLQRPRNPNFTADGITLPHHAAANEHIEPTRLLLEAGAFKDAPDTGDQEVTPLFMAADNGHTEVVGLLIDSGADKCKARRHDEATPLYIAPQKGHWQVVQLLVQAEVEINKATTEGATPLHTAVENADRDVVHVRSWLVLTETPLECVTEQHRCTSQLSVHIGKLFIF